MLFRSYEEALATGLPIREVEIVDALLPGLSDDVLAVNMIQRMTDSGRRVRFNVLCVVGNGDGYVGLAICKGKEVAGTIRKAIDKAKLNMIPVMRGNGSWESGGGPGTSVPLKITGRSGSTRVTLMPAPAGFTVTNVIEEAPYVDPVTVVTRVFFNSPIAPSSLGSAPYNPFIVTKGIRGNEIHLPSYAPTTLADLSLFGTSDDATIEGNNSSRYKNATGAPWAMHLPVSFDYPKENENILEVYNYFGTWAESGGYSYMDWYVEKQGYRNTAKIYIKE